MLEPDAPSTQHASGAEPGILIVQISSAFEQLWGDLARELETGTIVVTDGDTLPTMAAVAAVVLAAGGAEREALEWLDRTELPLPVPLFVVGADPARRMAAQMIGRGATDYFAMPEDVEILRNAMGSALERRRQAARREERGLAGPKAEAFSQIIGESPALKAVLARAAQLLPHRDATALIIGETGTGKELLARGLHEGGPRRGAPFVAVSCSALPEHLIESELFGHDRGAFTDAHADKPGLFEIASGGTLFLDEIGTLPVRLQPKLLRALEDKEVRRVGGTRSRTVDLRIIAATNQDLEQALKDGTLRQDLYFRLSAITLALPPLRERGDDVILIAEAFLRRSAAQYNLPVPRLNAEVRRALLGYHWPGNIRELRNAVSRALLLSPPGRIRIQELLPQTRTQPRGSGPIPFPAELRKITEAAARATLDLSGGNHSEAARRLQISRRRLGRLLSEPQPKPLVEEGTPYD